MAISRRLKLTIIYSLPVAGPVLAFLVMSMIPKYYPPKTITNWCHVEPPPLTAEEAKEPYHSRTRWYTLADARGGLCPKGGFRIGVIGFGPGW